MGGWVFLALIFIALNASWVAVGLMTRQMRPSTVSLFVNVIFTLFCLVSFGEVIRRWTKRSFTPSTLVSLYVSLSVATAVFGLDLLQPLLSVIAHPVWFAGEGNAWDITILPYLPELPVVWDKEALRGFYTGLSAFERWEVLKGWFPALLWWGAFLLFLGMGMLSLCRVFLADWTQRARLSYPIAQIPRELMTPSMPLFRRRLFWAGFSLAAFMNLLNGLHFLYPSVPSMGGWFFDLRPFFPHRPWNALGWTPITLLPFGVGLGFLMPLDLTLSCWVFYLVWKAQRVIAAMTGWWGLRRFPYPEEQQFGAYCFWALLALLPKAQAALGSALKGPREDRFAGEKSLSVSPKRRGSFEGLPPLSILVFLVGFLGLVILCVLQGMTWWLATLFFALYFLIALSITRIRAQLGSPVHDLHFAGPDRMLLYVLGGQALSRRDLCFLTLFGGFNRAYRGHPMPHMMEGMWLAQQLGVSVRKVLIAVGWGWVLGYLFGVWALLRSSYRFGGRPWYGAEVFRQLEAFLTAPKGFGWGSFFGILFGALQTALLAAVHHRFPAFPLHPAGFVVSGSWSMNLFWVSLMVAWLLKGMLLKWGGFHVHQGATPFFMGLVVGDYFVGSLWSIWGCLSKRPAYNFLP